MDTTSHEETSTLPKELRYLKPSYVCNATSGALLLYQLATVYILLSIAPAFIGIAAGLLYGDAEIFFLSDEYSMVLDLLTMITTVTGTLFIISLIKSRLKITLPSWKYNGWRISRILYYAIIGMGLSTCASILIQLLETLLETCDIYLSTPSFAPVNTWQSNVLLVISACVIAPIFEELLYRGLILSALKRFGNMFAIIITSFLFALAHGNIPQAVPVFALSLVLCYVALRSRSLYPSIMIHFINNALGMVERFVPDNDIISVLFILMELGIMLASCILLIRKRKNIRTYIQKHKGKRLLSYFKHICPILYLLLSIVLIAFSISIA